MDALKELNGLLIKLGTKIIGRGKMKNKYRKLILIILFSIVETFIGGFLSSSFLNIFQGWFIFMVFLFSIGQNILYLIIYEFIRSKVINNFQKQEEKNENRKSI